MSDLELRIATTDDFDDLAELISGAFLRDVEEDTLEAHRLVAEPDRTHVVVDDGGPVATGSVLTRDLSVPGAVAPAAHVTAVAVASTHRRRGLLNRVMRAQLAAVRERGTEPVAVLWASEGAIYGRFGYGLAAWHVAYRIPTRETTVPGRTPAGRLRTAVPRDAVEQLRDVYERARAARPGISGRPGRWWEYRIADPRSRRDGMSAERAVLYEVDGVPRGYAMWRMKGDWGETGPTGEVSVSEVAATSNDAYAALWRFLLSIDLTRTVRYGFAAVDEPLPHLVTNPSALGASVAPSLWVRVVDVPSALSFRRYAAPVDIVLEVADTMLPDNAGRWRLVGDMSSAKCEPTDAAPHLSLDVRELGAVYLGGVSLLSLGDAGLVTEHGDGTLLAASTAFGWHRAPASIEIF